MGPLIERRFKGEGDVEQVRCISSHLSISESVAHPSLGFGQARNMVLSSMALHKTRDLARAYSTKALQALDRLPDTTAKEALRTLTEKVVDRAK